MDDINACHGHITSLAVLRTHCKLGIAIKLMTAAQAAMEQDPNLVVDSSPGGGSSRWSPPAAGSLKLNVDASCNGSPGDAGIGGVLRDVNGAVFMLFSKAIGSEFPSIAEFLSINEAAMLFAASKWCSGYKLVIESNCSLVVQWFVDSFNGSPHLRTEFLQVRDMMQSYVSR